MTANLSKSSGKTVRVFLAVRLPGNVQASLGVVETAFPIRDLPVRWTPLTDTHITVRFLGDIAWGDVVRVQAVAREVAQCMAPFTLQIDSVGAFPSDVAPRVMWAGLRRDSGFESLLSLRVGVENALAAQGLAREERPFHPHITLARTRATASRTDRQAIGTSLAVARTRCSLKESFRVDAITLMQSVLSSAGSTYRSLAEESFTDGRGRKSVLSELRTETTTDS